MDLRPKSCFSSVDISEIRKMNALAGKDTINLGIGQLPNKLPPSVAAKLKEGIDNGDTRYTQNQGSLPLRELVAAYHSEKCGRSIGANQVVITNGAQGALWNILFTYLEAGDEILISEVAFSVYDTIAEMQGAVATTYALTEDLTIDFDDLESKISGKTKFIVINSPNNPTGTLLSPQEVQRLTTLAEERGVFIISDEIYSELCLGEDSQATSPLQYSEKVIVVDGISKRASATGLRVGWTVAPVNVTKPMVVANQYIATCASSLSQVGAMASLDGSSEDFLIQIRKDLALKRDYAYERLSSIKGIKVVRPKGAFYIFPDISRWGDSKTVAHALLEEKDVLTIPGIAFGTRGDRHIRISYAVPTEVLEEALLRIEQFITGRDYEN